MWSFVAHENEAIHDTIKINIVKKQRAEKKRHGSGVKLIVGLSPYCDMPLYTLPRIVL